MESTNPFFEEGKDIRIVTISEWLDWAAGKCKKQEIALPMIQRGFVWKPNQIIELWDTLLRGMPIGSLMVSESMGKGTGLTGDRKLREGGDNCLGLIDGQQRTLAMLVGWPLPSDTPYIHRLWVDFADDPEPGQLLRLRVTTLNQPFGFQRNDPNSKLSLDEKRRAREAFHGGNHGKQEARKLNQVELKKQQQDYFNKGRPFVPSSHPSLTVDMRELVGYWEKSNGKNWSDMVMEEIKKINYNALPDGVKLKVDERICILEKGLKQLFEAEIPLLRVKNEFFDNATPNQSDAEPPLAVLFKRVGSNATALSNADYIYSILKHLSPDLHSMVNELQGQNHAASLLTATDLVMSALRLAAAKADGVADNDNPDKNTFHRLHPKVKGHLDQVLKDIGSYFEIVQTALLYEGDSNKNGLPVHIFPHFGRPLVQVLLRLAHAGYLTKDIKIDRRKDVLRFVLYWMQWVEDAPRASLIAFSEIKTWREDGRDDLGKQIYNKIFEENRGLQIFSPTALCDIPHLVFSDKITIESPRPLRGESRFQMANAPDDVRKALDTYRHWWRPWTHRHPMLLWLQRAYVATQPWPDPMAGNEEDTPYDYDHILPQGHWNGWRGLRNRTDKLIDFVAEGEYGAHTLTGHAIGNVRVWDSSENRSDGADSPQVKSSDCSEQWFERSLIDREGKEDKYWFGSPADVKERSVWDADRTRAFQSAVEHRTFNLYKKLFEEAGFENWLN